MVTSIDSTFSTWIDQRGYNFFGNSGVAGIGQTYYTDGSQKTYFTQNAFSIFPGTTAETIVSGKIEFYFSGYLSNQASERILAHDMNTSVADLLVPHTSVDMNPAIFADTHTGTLLGEAVYADTFPGTAQFLQMDLSPAAIVWLNSMIPNTPFSVGFSVTDIAATDYVLLALTSVPGLSPRLILETTPQAIPEVSTPLLMGVVVAWLSLSRKRG